MLPPKDFISTITPSPYTHPYLNIPLPWYLLDILQLNKHKCCNHHFGLKENISLSLAKVFLLLFFSWFVEKCCFHFQISVHPFQFTFTQLFQAICYLQFWVSFSDCQIDISNRTGATIYAKRPILVDKQKHSLGALQITLQQNLNVSLQTSTKRTEFTL